VDGGQVLQAADECQALLTAGIDRDWSRQLPHLDFTVAQAVTHLAKATLERLFPWAPPDADPWPALLWANGRIDLPGQQRQVDRRWHCAPLEEWDGLNPAGGRGGGA
jgi:hypothetical protein